MKALFAWLAKWTAKLDAEALGFDMATAMAMVLVQQIAGSDRQFLGMLVGPVAHLVIIAAIVIILVRLKYLVVTVRETGSRGLAMVVSGALGLLSIVQPIFLTGVAAKLGIVTPTAPDMLSFALGLSFIFGAVIGFDEEKKFDPLYSGLSTLGSILFFADLPLQFGSSFLAVALVDVAVILAWVVLKFRGKPVRGLDSFPRETEPRHWGLRLLVSTGVGLCLWAWWQAVLLPILKPEFDLLTRILLLYMTGPLLYRIALVIKPPVNPINAILGLAAIVWALV
ncbi:MAG TPA: hypothetical protein PLD82_07840 [Spirochaetota bacterium]|nr:hypothetical protein [Spirochaetota bacterium]